MRHRRSLAEQLALLQRRDGQEGGSEVGDDSASEQDEAQTATRGPARAAQQEGSVNQQFGGISPSIRILTAIAPSQAKATAAAAAAAIPNPNTLQTVVIPSAVATTIPQVFTSASRALPSVTEAVAAGVVEASPNAQSEAAQESPQAEPSLIREEASGETGAAAEPANAEATAEVVNGAESAVAEMQGAAEGTGAPEIGEKESNVILPDNNRGIAVGIVFGVLALMAVLIFLGFMLVKWRKKSAKEVFDRPPPAGINRSAGVTAPIAEKMPPQNQYANYANLETGGGGNGSQGGVRQSIGQWIQNTSSRFSTPTTDGVVSMYRRDEQPPMPPPPSFMTPGGGR